MNRLGMIVSMAGLLALIGCAVSNWNIDTYRSPGTDVAAGRTFFWKGGDYATAAQLEPEIVPLADRLARAAVVEELLRKGYVEADSAGSADLTVGYQVSGVSRFVTEETPRVGAPSPDTVLSPGEIQPPPASSVPREMQVRDGSIIVFIDDAKAGRLAWRGEVSGEMRAGSPEHAARILARMAREIAREIPARK